MSPRLACVDVCYSSNDATAACVLFEAWTDQTPAKEIVRDISDVAPYESGAFYKRELPCLLKVLSALDEVPAVVVIDGYVWLDSHGKPGLGARLHEALGGPTAVIGVAKTAFSGAPAIPITRGTSKSPLFISAVGMMVNDAAEHIAAMSGEHRIPTLLRRVDRLCRRDG